jgi:hypothetical protein
MHLVEILLPLLRNDGSRQPQALFASVREEMVARFGGLTAFARSPAEGVWEQDGERSKDEIVIFEVMTEKIDRDWWAGYRQRLERDFEQEAIVVRAREVDLL